MTKVLAFLAAGALVASAFAGASTPLSASTTINTANLDLGTGTVERGPLIYSDITTSGYYLNGGTTATYPLPLSDDIHAVAGGTVTSFQLGYYTPTAGTFSLVIKFWAGDPLDSTPPAYPLQPAGGLATYTLSGLPGGGAWIVNITGVNVPVGPDFWFEGDWSGSYGLGGGGATVGPLLSGGLFLGGGGELGYSHSSFGQTGSTWTLGASTWTDFVLSFNVIPEPATIGLLALAGLVTLRRR